MAKANPKLLCNDWKDDELIKAYEKGMTLQEKKKNEENSSDTVEMWHEGDFCRAVYPEDNLLYEAVIVSIGKDLCTVMFLGYEDELRVKVRELRESRGKEARKAQMQDAKQFNAIKEQDSESVMSGNVSYLNEWEMHGANFKPNYSARYNNPTSSHRMPHHYPAPNAMFPAPPAPPMPNAMRNQDPRIYQMLSAWYLAGYYTGLHEAKTPLPYLPAIGKGCPYHHKSTLI